MQSLRIRIRIRIHIRIRIRIRSHTAIADAFVFVSDSSRGALTADWANKLRNQAQITKSRK